MYSFISYHGEKMDFKEAIFAAVENLTSEAHIRYTMKAAAFEKNKPAFFHQLILLRE